MRARILRDYLTGAASAAALAAEAETAIERGDGRQTHYLEDLDTPFEVEGAHLLRLCDAVLAGELSPESLEAIAYTFMASTCFHWDGTTETGAVIAQTIMQWATPESSYALTADSVAKYRRRLLTGERAFTRDDVDRRATPRIARETAARGAGPGGGMSPDDAVVAIAGATGLIGQAVIARLSSERGIRRLIALVRRPLDPRPSTLDPRIVDFEHLDAGAIVPAATVLCALGTTMRTAGSRDAFHRVDHDYVVAVARAARDAGARRFILVSALGADPWSRVFYNRVKGEAERDVRAIGIPELIILRPSLLLGPRREFRPMERLGGMLGRLVPGRYRPIHVAAVAEAIARLLARPHAPGERVIESRELERMARAEGG